MAEPPNVADLIDKLDRALAESERQRLRAQRANNRSQLLLVVAEKAIGQLSGHPLQEALQNELNAALRTGESEPPVEAEPPYCPRSVIP